MSFVDVSSRFKRFLVKLLKFENLFPKFSIFVVIGSDNAGCGDGRLVPPSVEVSWYESKSMKSIGWLRRCSLKTLI